MGHKTTKEIEAFDDGFARGKEYERLGNHICFVGCKVAACQNGSLRARIAELERFILSCCCCKSMPGSQPCLFCEAVNGEKKDGT